MIYGNETCFVENWYRDSYATKNTTTVNSVSTADYGVIDLTSTGTDSYIHMPSLGSFAPATYKYVHILYKVISASGGTPAIYYYNAAGGAAADRVVSGSAYLANGIWNVMTIDMSKSAKWLDSNITGWRFDWTNANGPNVQFGYIALSSSATPPYECDVNLLFPYVPSQTVTTYTSGSGTWTCPAGVTSVYVECWGGGGCGGFVMQAASDDTLTSAGGGGAGAYAAGTVSVTPGNSYAYAVGAGGLKTWYNSGEGNGGSSTFNSTSIVAVGGTRGPVTYVSYSNTYTNGAAGGLAASCTGTVKYSGGNGNKGYTIFTGGYTHLYSGAGGGCAGSTGAGGNAPTPAGNGLDQAVGGTGTAVGGGSGANGSHCITAINPGPWNAEGTNGSGYGGAGSGACVARPRYLPSGTYLPGGNGANGAVRITYEV